MLGDFDRIVGLISEQYVGSSIKLNREAKFEIMNYMENSGLSSGTDEAHRKGNTHCHQLLTSAKISIQHSMMYEHVNYILYVENSTSDS